MFYYLHGVINFLIFLILDVNFFGILYFSATQKNQVLDKNW